MNNEERDIISRFIARVGGAPGTGFGNPAAPRPALPPLDQDADALIGQLFGQYPEARYRITQMAFVQEAALAEAQNRIQRLQWELQQTQQAAAQPQGRGGLFGGLFGGGSRPPSGPQFNTAPPPPQYAPGMAQPGMFQQGGSGFLGSALTTAAGVAGGMVAGNALMNLFSDHHHSNDAMTDTGAALPGSAAVSDPASDPWGGAGTAVEGDGYWSNNGTSQAEPSADPGWSGDGKGFSQSDPGWNDPSSDAGSGWNDAGSNDDAGW